MQQQAVVAREAKAPDLAARLTGARCWLPQAGVAQMEARALSSPASPALPKVLRETAALELLPCRPLAETRAELGDLAEASGSSMATVPVAVSLERVRAEARRALARARMRGPRGESPLTRVREVRVVENQDKLLCLEFLFKAEVR